MNVYIASASYNRELISLFADRLTQDLKINVVSRWHKFPPLDEVQHRAHMDYADIDHAHLLLAVYPYGYGTASEMGYALGRKIPIIYYRHDAHEDEDPLPSGKLMKCYSDLLVHEHGIIVSSYTKLLKGIELYQSKTWESWKPS